MFELSTTYGRNRSAITAAIVFLAQVRPNFPAQGPAADRRSARIGHEFLIAEFTVRHVQNLPRRARVHGGVRNVLEVHAAEMVAAESDAAEIAHALNSLQALQFLSFIPPWAALMCPANLSFCGVIFIRA